MGRDLGRRLIWNQQVIGLADDIQGWALVKLLMQTEKNAIARGDLR